MEKLTVAGPWGFAEGRNIPQVFLDHLQGQLDWSLSDITGQPAENIAPAPNLFNVEIICPTTLADAIAADNTYLILTREAYDETI